MKPKIIIPLVMLVVLLSGIAILKAKENSPFEDKPTLDIDFSVVNKGVLKASNWDFFETDPVYNDEQQKYTAESSNVRIENGVLYIQALKTDDGYTSAKISPKENGKRIGFLGGKFEITAKLPRGCGLWPAFWLLSLDQKYTKNATDEQWAKDQNFWSKNGEIDIMETTGCDPTQITSDVHTYSTVSSGNDSNVGSIKVKDADTQYHLYGLEWTAESLVFTIDGKAYHTVKKVADWPFDQPFYLMINLAMGGSLGGTIDDQSSEGWILAIKNIRYYPLKVQK